VIISQMNVVLKATTGGFIRAMDKVEAKTKRTTMRIKALGGGIKALAGMWTKAAMAMVAAAWPVKKMFDLGAGIAETGSKFNTVFGPAGAKQIDDFLSTFAHKAGLTNTEARGLMATTGAIAQGMGFTQQASADMATEITKLAGDLSSFNNLPTEEVLMAINSALTGEREQMKRLGIVILEADVQAKAFAMTGKDVAKTLTQQEKAAASLAIMTERAGVAVGDLDRTQNSAANVARRLKAMFLELRDTLATALQPAFGELLTMLADNEQKFRAWQDAIVENSGVISAWARVVIRWFIWVATVLAAPVRIMVNAGQVFVDLLQAAKAFFTQDWDEFENQITSVMENVKDAGQAIVDPFLRFGDVIGASMDAIFGTHENPRQLPPGMVELPELLNNVAAAGEDAEDAVEKIIEAVETLQTRLATLTEQFTQDFITRMNEAVHGAENAFAGFFDYMHRKLTEMAIKWAFFKAMMALGVDADFIKNVTGLERAATPSGTVLPMPSFPALPRPELPRPAFSVYGQGQDSGGLKVHQSINFNVQAIDARDAARFIKEQGGNIAQVVADASRDSVAFRRSLQGGL
jgi:hypothetical protein